MRASGHSRHATFPARAQVATQAGTCQITVHDRFESALPAWRALEDSGALMTPYQRFDFLRAWHTSLGKSEGTSLRIVEGRTEDGTIAFVWPLGRCACYGMPMLGWLGGKHVNFSMGLYNRNATAALTGSDWSRLLRKATRLAGAVASVLHNQPESFGGTDNPIAATRSLTSASPCFAMHLEPDYDATLARLRNKSSRKKIRRNIRRLEETAGPVELRHATSHVEIIEALAALRMHKLQLDNCRADRRIFSDARVTGFLTQAALPHEKDARPTLEIYTLNAGDNIAATFGCAVNGTRAAGNFISIDSECFAQCAPGEVLIAKLIERLCARGIETLDLGIGEAEYKRRWCDIREPLFDTIVTTGLRGNLLAAPATRICFTVKAALKHSPRMLGLIQAAMGKLALKR